MQSVMQKISAHINENGDTEWDDARNLLSYEERRFMFDAVRELEKQGVLTRKPHVVDGVPHLTLLKGQVSK